MAGIIDFIDKAYSGFLMIFDRYLSNFTAALLILFIGFIIARLVERILNKIASELELNMLFSKATSYYLDLENMISKVIAGIIYIITILLVLNQLDLTYTLFYIIGIFLVAVIVISFVLAAKDFLPNAVAGLKIGKSGKVKEGRLISLKSVQGTVQKIGLLETKVLSKSKDIIHIPNVLIAKELKV